MSLVDEFENVTAIINLYQLLINLCNLETSLEMSFEKLTWNGTPYPRFAVHVLNCCCKVRPLLSFWIFSSTKKVFLRAKDFFFSPYNPWSFRKSVAIYFSFFKIIASFISPYLSLSLLMFPYLQVRTDIYKMVKKKLIS